MARAWVKSVRVFDSRVDAMSEPAGDVWRWTRQQSRETAELASILAPVGQTGRLASNIDYSVTPVPHGCVGTATAAMRYAEWVHEGTGVYGPIGIPITPTSGQIMVFRWWQFDGGSKVWKLRSVRGQRPQPFLSQALSAQTRLW